MSATGNALAAALLAVAAALGSAPAQSADRARDQAEPRWAFEFKGGEFEPDLDGYAQFYGDDGTTLFAITGAYRIRRWLEAGAEIGYLSDEGTGRLATSGAPGGEVTYTLVPATVFVGVRGVYTEEQLLVPYLSVGATMAYYDQDIEFQSGRSGTSDVGASIRAGLGILLDRLDPWAGVNRPAHALKNSYLFLEYQNTSTEAGDVELGGDSYLIGVRLEFGP